MPVESFVVRLARMGIELTRGVTTTLQINVGFLCNQTCRHCHLEAGPDCREVMAPHTMDAVVAYARRGCFSLVDVTGGAPEMHPQLGDWIDRLSQVAPKLMLRSNLTALRIGSRQSLMELCRARGVILVASLPSVNAAQVDSQRGRGVFDESLATLRALNALGYGQPECGLELHLVSNPVGAFLPAPQAQTEKKFKEALQRKWGVVFNSLYTFANVPLGRFRRWLEQSENYEGYMHRLAAAFNPCTTEKLMCRSLVSVSWDGYLYDCDFNQASGLCLGGCKRHVEEMGGPPSPGTPIATSDHCYACTAGSGFT